MSSNKFLQRFEGKIQTVGKTGIQGLFGARNGNFTVYTNSNFYQQQKNKTTTSLGKPKPIQQQKIETKNLMHEINHPAEKQEMREEVKMPLVNERDAGKALYLPSISNPNQQAHRKTEKQPQSVLLQEITRAKQGDEKKKTSYSSRSLEKRKDSGLGKLGGLGANIGGEEWLLKKKKMQKMQAFAEQVKLVCKQMPKIPRQEKRFHLAQQQRGRQESACEQSQIEEGKWKE